MLRFAQLHPVINHDMMMVFVWRWTDLNILSIPQKTACYIILFLDIEALCLILSSDNIFGVL